MYLHTVSSAFLPLVQNCRTLFHARRTKFTTFKTVGLPLIEMQFNLSISYCNLATVSKNYRIIIYIYTILNCKADTFRCFHLVESTVESWIERISSRADCTLELLAFAHSINYLQNVNLLTLSNCGLVYISCNNTI